MYPHLTGSAQVDEVEGKEYEKKHSRQGSGQGCNVWVLEPEDVDVGPRFLPGV